MTRYPVTVQMIVKNEENFVGYALESVAPCISKYLIYDTGSDDNTVDIIRQFISNHPELEVTFKQVAISSPKDINRLRLEQCQQTTTPWFLLLDGDEIWPEKQLTSLLQITKEVPHEILAVVNRTREAVGDIRHYLPDSFGKYELLGKKGHFNIRLMRTLPYELTGEYPNESYSWQGRPINTLSSQLTFSSAWYLHTTHLPRTSKQQSRVFGRRNRTVSAGKVMKADELPGVFSRNMPYLSKNVLKKRSLIFFLAGIGADAVRRVIKK